MTLAALATSRIHWVGGAVVELEAAAPEVVTRMLGLTDRGGYGVNAQGQGVSLRSGAHGDFLPFAGLTALNGYAIARGEELQRELIG